MEIYLRVIRTGWQGFKRNGWLSFVAIFMMMQTLLLITLFIILNVVVNKTVQAINDRIDVAVFFKEYIPQDDILIFKDEISSIEGIKDIIFVSQQQALESYIAYNQDSQALLDVIGDDSSFLPASLEVKLDNPYLIESVVAEIRTQDKNQLILETSLKKNQEIINSLRSISRFIGIANITMSFIFIIIALLIIFNTIRITIFTRREEIEIMKLVGATDWYIRWPFIIEGAIYGIIGALLAFIVTMLGYWLLTSSIGSRFFSLDVIGGAGYSIFTPWFMLKLLMIQLLFGIVVGSVSSYFSTKRHLHI